MPVVSRLVLRGEYDVWRREQLRSGLERLDLSGDVCIEMRDVSLMDAGAVSLLIHLQRRLHERAPGARVILSNAPRIVRRVIDLCGASELFVFTSDG